MQTYFEELILNQIIKKINYFYFLFIHAFEEEDKIFNHNEKICPICRKIIRSDVNDHEYCALCGMGIPSDSLNDYIYKYQYGKTLRFCCYKCFSIYKRHISNIYQK